MPRSAVAWHKALSEIFRGSRARNAPNPTLDRFEVAIDADRAAAARR
jgi:hypothetical protein